MTNLTPPSAEQQLFLLQTATGMYPTGAFNHSFGFETLVEEGLVYDRKTLSVAVRDWLLYGLAPMDGALTRLAFNCARSEDYEQLAEVDRFSDRIKTNTEERAASVKTGQALIRITERVFAGQAIAALSTCVQAGNCVGHQAVAFGAASADAGLNETVHLLGFMQSSISNLINVIARIVPLGQTDVQLVLRELWPSIVSSLEIARSRSLDTVATSTGGLDIAGLRHETQSVRLCMS